MFRVIKRSLYLLLIFLLLIPFWYVVFIIAWPFQHILAAKYPRGGRYHRGKSELNLLHDWVKAVTWVDIKEFIFE